MEKDKMKGEIAVVISDKRKKVRFKAGTEMPDKVNLVVIDVEEVTEGDGHSIEIRIEFRQDQKYDQDLEEKG